MKKIGTYLRSFWQSVREKPIVFVLFVFTILISVVTSGYFYRKVLYTFKFEIKKTSYEFRIDENFSRKEFYDIIKDSNIDWVDNDYFELTAEGKQVESGDKVDIRYSCQYTISGIFTKKMLESGENLAVISSDLSEEKGLKVNDLIDIQGKEFKIANVNNKTTRTIYFNASSNIPFIPRKPPHYPWKNAQFHSFGNLSESKLAKMNSNGWMVNQTSKPDNSAAYKSMAIGISLMVLAMINIFVAYKFIADKNSKRYTLFKTMGAKNGDIAVMMILEAFGVVLLSFFVGILVEYLIAKPIIGIGLAPLNIKDYGILFGINCFLSMATTIWLVTKKAIAQPMNCKQRGRQ